MKLSIRVFTIVCALAASMFLSACAKKKVAVATPQAPPPTRPTASLSVSRAEITKGESTVVSWNTSNAETVNIAGLGSVAGSGSRSVSPSESTTYSLSAKGPGGEAEASARVTVNQPVAVTKQPDLTLEQLFAQNVKDIYFDYDQYGIRASDQSVAEADAKFLAAHPDAKVLIEGHCDERGSEDYNLGLGDNRAGATRDFLTKLGVSASQIKTISYGKEKPFCSTGDNEACFQQNRRAHFVLQADNMNQGR